MSLVDHYHYAVCGIIPLVSNSDGIGKNLFPSSNFLSISWHYKQDVTLLLDPVTIAGLRAYFSDAIYSTKIQNSVLL